MAQITYNATNIDAFVISFLLDCLLNPEENTKYNKQFRELIKDFDKRNLRPLLLKYYMKLTGPERASYRKLKGSLTGEGHKASIILKPLSDKEKDENLISKERKEDIKDKIIKVIKALRESENEV